MNAPPVVKPEVAPLPSEAPGLLALLKVSLGLGLVGFGGGLTVLGILQGLVVGRRRWLTEEEFANSATIAQILPGGAASNVLAAIGLRFAGVPGALVSVFGFVAPGAALTLALAVAYRRFGAVPDATAFLAGLNASVVGVILAIALRMSRTSIARLWQMAVAGAALLLALVGGAGSGEVAILGAATGLSIELGARRKYLLNPWRRMRAEASPPAALPDEGAPLAPRPPPPPPPPLAPSTPGSTLRIPVMIVAGIATPLLLHTLGELASVAVVFFRTGLGAYGGGFAIIPSLQAQVLSNQWLTERQFADAVAVGKLTPGPILLMATFVGYLKDGLPGALVATVAVLAAPLLLVFALNGFLEQARGSRWVQAALRGLTPAVVGLMIAAALTLGSGVRSGIGAGIAATVALTLIRFDRVNPVAMLALGGAARVIYRLATGS